MCIGKDISKIKSCLQGRKCSFEIITVFGPENSGKTTLIWAVYNKLMESGGELTYFHIVGADARDFHAIVVWEGKIIALCSIGDKVDEENKPKLDDWQYVKDGIEIAKEYKAEILVNTVSDLTKKGKKDDKDEGDIQYDEKENIKSYKKILTEKEIFYIFRKFILDRHDEIEKQTMQKQIYLKQIITLLERL